MLKSKHYVIRLPINFLLDLQLIFGHLENGLLNKLTIKELLHVFAVVLTNMDLYEDDITFKDLILETTYRTAKTSTPLQWPEALDDFVKLIKRYGKRIYNGLINKPTMEDNFIIRFNEEEDSFHMVILKYE